MVNQPFADMISSFIFFANQRSNEAKRPYQDADLLTRLRNELLHYKSKWGEQMDGAKLFSTLEQLRFDKPVFVHANGTFFHNDA